MSDTELLSGDLEVEAANAALLIMRAAHPQATSVHFDIPGTTGNSGLTADPARILASMAKPLRCSARLTDGSLEIRCETLASPHGENSRFRASPPFQMALSRTAGRGGPAILLIGSAESMLLSSLALNALLDGYVIDCPYTISGDDPSPDQQGQGISWVLRASAGAIITEAVEDLDLPAPLAELISEEYQRAVREHGG